MNKTNTLNHWREDDGVIYCHVISNGLTGHQWIEYFERRNLAIDDEIKRLLLSKEFQPTNDVVTQIAIIKSVILKNNWTTKQICAEADKRMLGKFMRHSVELACLIRAKFDNNELDLMGLRWIIVMQEPIKGPLGGQFLISIASTGLGICAVCHVNEEWPWLSGGGFMFEELP